VDGEVDALREVRAQESVGVLVERAFPRPAGIGEEDAVDAQFSELVVAGHLRALISCEGASRFGGQISHRSDAADLEVMGAAAVGQVDEPEVEAGAVDEGADGGAVGSPGCDEDDDGD
jgi:hypothetical protein